ncbi:SH3 domain-containing protein [Heliorestis acidaminivorans]|uniref:SH3 domain-containing protein n=1 Tax=Heliorestis acidaminivorans TaxID=553427 RepID=A0A6I0F234_9FIRM|nr:peptidoglycan-binding protein [Heliorestis acidaminivorans]KAB2952306.1 SH3 domain-containing protein [Heliorestis acidaminivorans]
MTRKLTIAAMAVFLLLAMSISMVFATSEVSTGLAMVERGAYLRTEPKLNATRIQLVPKGETLVVLEQANQYWQKVQTQNGRIGYITTNPTYVKSIPSNVNATLQLERSLKRGDRGDDVVEVQMRLSKLGFYSGRVDGDFGPMTHRAVESFQREHRLVVDGVVGPQTTRKLNELLAGDAQSTVTTTAPATAPAPANNGTAPTSTGTEATPTGQASVTTKTLGKGTSWETEMYVIKGVKEGPTVMIVGGVHGNEPAGFRAARQVKDWKIENGTLIVIPDANKVGINNNRRNSSFGDLNRAFPQSNGANGSDALSRAIWAEYQNYKPQYVLDLHEGYDYNVQNKNSVGQTIIYHPSGQMQSFANKLTSELNKGLPASKRFNVLRNPVGGSLARAAGLHGSEAAIFETCTKDPINTRVQYQIKAVEMFFDHAGMKRQ